MATPAYFNQYPDVAASYAQNNYGLTPEQYAQVHYQNYGVNEQRISPAAAAAQTTITPTYTPIAAAYFQQNPDVAQAYQENTYGLTPDEFAATHYQLYGQAEQRAAPAAAATTTGTGTGTSTNTRTTTTTGTGTTGVRTTTGAGTTGTVGTRTTGTSTTGASLPYFQLNPDVAAAYLTNNYGMTPEQFAAAHYAKYGQFEQRSAPSTSPFASATQGFPQNFQNYQSIPIGAQYNPNVVGGTGSPYSQIMGQMRPAGPYNPYMGVASNTPMGGYDPGLYDRIAQANAVAKLAAGTNSLLDQSGGDANGGDTAGIGSQGGDAAGNTGGGPGTGADGDAAYAKGGMVNGLFGMNPPGPDDGAGYLDRGEYVVKKDAVSKYGRGLLDMINEGKVPAKKMKSLLG